MNQRRTGNLWPIISSAGKCSDFNFARVSESPFVHCTQPCGFVCQRQKPLGYEREARVIKRKVGEKMNRGSTQMEQFFRFMLAFVIVIILGGVVAKYLDDNYSSFQIEETADKDTGKENSKEK